jgi:hypothetical protein
MAARRTFDLLRASPAASVVHAQHPMQPRSSLLSRPLGRVATLLLVGCAATAAPKAPGHTTTTSGTTTAATTAGAAPPVTNGAIEATAEPVVECDLVCEPAEVVLRTNDTPDYHAHATANANRVLEAMHPDLLACYTKRLAVRPDAHAFLTIDLVIGPDGRVRWVETTGGALLGPSTMKCIVDRVSQASFEPPHGGGTLRIHVPFALRRTAPNDPSL